MPTLLSRWLGQPYLLVDAHEEAIITVNVSRATIGATRRRIVYFFIIFYYLFKKLKRPLHLY